MENIIKLNVGGTLYTTTRSTLTSLKNTLLGSMFSENNKHLAVLDKDGYYFFDRNGRLFEKVLDVYRNGGLFNLPDNAYEKQILLDEFSFWGLDNELNLELTKKQNSCVDQETLNFINKNVVSDMECFQIIAVGDNAKLVASLFFFVAAQHQKDDSAYIEQYEDKLFLVVSNLLMKRLTKISIPWNIFSIVKKSKNRQCIRFDLILYFNWYRSFDESIPIEVFVLTVSDKEVKMSLYCPDPTSELGYIVSGISFSYLKLFINQDFQLHVPSKPLYELTISSSILNKIGKLPIKSSGIIFQYFPEKNQLHLNLNVYSSSNTEIIIDISTGNVVKTNSYNFSSYNDSNPIFISAILEAFKDLYGFKELILLDYIDIFTIRCNVTFWSDNVEGTVNIESSSNKK